MVNLKNLKSKQDKLRYVPNLIILVHYLQNN